MKVNKILRTVAVVVMLTAVLASTASARTGVVAPMQQVGEVTVIVDGLNVRSGPSTGDGIIGKLACGTKFQPNAKTSDNAWWRFTYNGGTGWVFAAYATVGGTCATGAAPAAAAPAAPAAAPAAGGVNVAVTSPFLNVRSGPGTGNSIIGRLNQGDSVAANGKTADGQWLRITYNGQTGFVFATYTNYASGGGGAVPAAGAPAAAPAAVAPAGNFGGFEIGAHFKETNIMPRMRNEAGMTWAKYQVVMPGGAPDLSGVIAAAHGNGIKLLVGAIGDRGRAGDAGYHDEFARALASLAQQGVDAIEVWNEPNLDREYGGSGNGQVNPENYADMLRKAYGAIKSVSPNTLVISAAPAPTGYFGGGCSNGGCDDEPFMNRLGAAGGAAWADCIGAHHNGTMVGPDTVSGAPVGSAGHHQWYFQGTLAVAYNAFGGKRPVCWTELGYVTKDGIAGSLPGGFSWGNSITMQNQVDWLRRAAELSKASGKVRFMIVWNADFRQFDDDPQAGYSIFRPDGSCPACGGLKQISGK